MASDQTNIEDLLRGAYADAAAGIGPDDIAAEAPPRTAPVRWPAATKRSVRWAMPLASAAAVIVVVVAATAVPRLLNSGSHHRGQAVPGPVLRDFAYVDRFNDTVVPINLATGTALKPIPLRTAGEPAGLALTPDGRTLYEATVNGQVKPVDAETGRAEKPIWVRGIVGGFLMTPDGKTGFVLYRCPDDNGVAPGCWRPSGVAVVNLVTRSRTGFIGIAGANYFVMTPDGKTLYVLGSTQYGVTTLTPIVTATGRELTPIVLGASEAWDMAMAPDGKTVYVMIENGFDGGTMWLDPVDTATNKPDTPIEIHDPSQRNKRDAFMGDSNLVIASDDRTAYTVDMDRTAIIPIDLVTGQSLSPIPLRQPACSCTQLVTSPDSSTMYVVPDPSLNSSTVMAIDTATNTTLKPIKVPESVRLPDSIVFSQDGKTAYIFSYRGQPCVNGPTNRKILAELERVGAECNGPPWLTAASAHTLLTPVDVATGTLGTTITIPGAALDVVLPR